jgi:hypothetical protein
MDYTLKHSQALKKLAAKGAPVIFSISTPGTYVEATDEYTDPVFEEIAGQAVEIPGDPEEYKSMELLGTEAVTLFFVPTVFGATPKLHMSVDWAGALRTVSQIFPIRPAEELIAARVIVV